MKKKLLKHFCIIVLYLTYHLWKNLLYDMSAQVPYLERTIYFMSDIVVAYAAYLFILPTFFKPKRYVLFTLSIIVLFGLYCLFQYFLDYRWHDYLAPDDKVSPFEASFFFSIHFYYFFQSLVFGFAYWMHKDAITRERITRELESQKVKLESQKVNLEGEALRSELSLLKAQINPHLLFNILNFFYTKTYKLSEEIGEAIVKLANLLRYTMREHAGDRVPLSEEVENITNYIALQQMLFNDELHVDLQISGPVEKKEILPLLLITFIENAFKHGHLKSASHPLLIRIQATDQHIDFFVKNKKGRERKEFCNGIGLVNTKRRLVLAYDDRQTLKIGDEGDFFTAHLVINQPDVPFLSDTQPQLITA
jgi:two-component system, LytTR family, sensor kinase